MILKRLHIQGFGPFFHPDSLDIDPQVTILTGPNDVGKSAILRLIQMICAGIPASEDDVNVDRIRDSGVVWNQDQEITCIATFVLSHNFPSYLNPGNLLQDDEVDILFTLAHGQKKIVGFRRGGQPFDPGSKELSRLPSILFLPQPNEASSIIDITTTNPVEQELLRIAFGSNSIEKMKGRSNPGRHQMLRTANDELNSALNELLPQALGLELALGSDNINDLTSFTVGFRDKHRGDTPVHLRGVGVRKILTLMIALSQVKLQSDYLYILYDEPENSLHADAQHLLRMVLENLAAKNNVQVIYATHSPSMINSFNPNGLRLLERAMKDGKATTLINNKPYQENFLRVRTSLGITPADSLLYAPVSIIVEGPTEISCLPLLLPLLHDKQVAGFEQLDRILPLVHIVDGEGDSFEHWSRMAKSQGSKPVIFVDGDKIRRVRQLTNQGKLNGVPVIHLDEGCEFEDIVPVEVYFQALAVVSGQPTQYEDYQKWHEENHPPEKMITKCVAKWLRENFEFSLDKPAVMKKALELVDVDNIRVEKLRELVNQIIELVR